MSGECDKCDEHTLECRCIKLTGKDLAYWERNQLVLYLSKLFPSWLERHPKEDVKWENDWRNIVFINFPEGLFSWHIHDFEFDYFKHLPFKEGNSWDGASAEQKYNLLRHHQDIAVNAKTNL